LVLFRFKHQAFIGNLSTKFRIVECVFKDNPFVCLEFNADNPVFYRDLPTSTGLKGSTEAFRHSIVPKSTLKAVLIHISGNINYKTKTLAGSDPDESGPDELMRSAILILQLFKDVSG
jgi:hypothetical protein